MIARPRRSVAVRVAVAVVSCLLLGCWTDDAPNARGLRGGAAREVASVPYCGADALRRAGADDLLASLQRTDLLLSCDDGAQLNAGVSPAADRDYLKRRDVLAARYGDLRRSFRSHRNAMRSGPRDEALSAIEAWLPAALTGAAAAPWLGTPWDFYGASAIPGQGRIACGYFIAATLYAAGFNVRVSQESDGIRHHHLAGWPSERMIVRLVDEHSIRRFSDVPVAEFVGAMSESGPGMYIVGLDQHVGYLIVDEGGEVWFLHAKPGKEVVVERPGAAPFLADSRYRVVGKLDHRTAAIWLDGEAV